MVYQKQMVTSSSREKILSTRERFNQAIADKDTNAIRAFLAPSYHIVTGRSLQNHGADEESARWAETFAADPSVLYIRTTREISINEDWGIAEELGNWKGQYTAEGQLVHAAGVYSAKWQRAENGEWVLQAEVFTTLKYDGPESGCLKPEPIYPKRM